MCTDDCKVWKESWDLVVQNVGNLALLGELPWQTDISFAYECPKIWHQVTWEETPGNTENIWVACSSDSDIIRWSHRIYIKLIGNARKTWYPQAVTQKSLHRLKIPDMVPCCLKNDPRWCKYVTRLSINAYKYHTKFVWWCTFMYNVYTW